MTPDELDKNYGVFEVDWDDYVASQAKHEAVATQVRELARDWASKLPPGRHASLAQTALEEAHLWAHAALDDALRGDPK